MNRYHVQRIESEEELAALPVLKLTGTYGPRTPEIVTEARLGHDGEDMLVLFTAREPEIRAEEENPLGEACRDSCMELFLCPEPGDLRYFNVECSASGCMFVGFGDGISNLLRLLPGEGSWPEVFGVHISRTEEGWQLMYRLKGSFIRQFFPGFRMEKGLCLRANLYKCGDACKTPHWQFWNPVPEKEPFTFHCPEHFGELILE